jgi:hypothetical protein
MTQQETPSRLPRLIQIATVVAWFVLPAMLVVAAALSAPTGTWASAINALKGNAVIEVFWMVIFGCIARAIHAERSVHRTMAVCFGFSVAMFATFVILGLGVLCVATNANTCV